MWNPRLLTAVVLLTIVSPLGWAHAQSEMCRGTKRFYNGSCLYPDEIAELKKEEAENSRQAGQKREHQSEKSKVERRSVSDRPSTRSTESNSPDADNSLEGDEPPQFPVIGKVHDIEVIRCGDRDIESESDTRFWSRGRIFVDGEPYGPTNEEIEIFPGLRRITVKSGIFEDFDEFMTILPGENFEIKPKGHSRDDKVGECLAIVMGEERFTIPSGTTEQVDSSNVDLAEVSLLKRKRNRLFLISMVPGIPGTILFPLGLSNVLGKDPGTIWELITVAGALAVAGSFGLMIAGIATHVAIPDHEDYASIVDIKNAFDLANTNHAGQNHLREGISNGETIFELSFPINAF